MQVEGAEVWIQGVRKQKQPAVLVPGVQGFRRSQSSESVFNLMNEQPGRRQQAITGGV